MNTPTIAAALPNPVAPASAARTGTSPSDNETSAASFSQILGRQHAAQGQQQGQQGQQAQGTASDTGHASPKTDRSDDTEKKGKEAADDAELATLAGDQGLSLPQIALNLAAHAMPKADKAATAAAPGTDRATLLPAADKAPTTQAALEAGAATGSGVSKGADIATDAQDPMAASAKGASSPAAGNAVTDAARSALAALSNVKPEAKLDGKPASGGANTSDGKTTSGTNAPATRGMTQSERAQASAAASAMAAAQAGAAATTPQRSAAPQPQSTNTPAATTTVAATGDMTGLAAAGTAAQAAVQIQTTGAAASSGSLSISTPLQQPQWPADFGRQVVTLAQTAHNQTQTAELRLDPPDLGPLRITININDNVAQAVFVSAHASVRHAVENALPQLQQQLAQAGISLGQTSVNDQGQQQTPFEQSFQSGGRQHAVTAVGAGEPAIESTAARAGARVLRNPDAIVDTFA